MQSYDALVRDLYEAGHPIAEIRARVGISEPTLYKALRRAGGEPIRKPGAGKLSDKAKLLMTGADGWREQRQEVK